MQWGIWDCRPYPRVLATQLFELALAGNFDSLSRSSLGIAAQAEVSILSALSKRPPRSGRRARSNSAQLDGRADHSISCQLLPVMDAKLLRKGQSAHRAIQVDLYSRQVAVKPESVRVGDFSSMWKKTAGSQWLLRRLPGPVKVKFTECIPLRILFEEMTDFIAM